MTSSIRIAHKRIVLPTAVCGYDSAMSPIVSFGHYLLQQGARQTMLECALKPRLQTHLPDLCARMHDMSSPAWGGHVLRLAALSLLGMLSGAPAYAEAPTSYTLVINLTPAVCATNPEFRRLRQCQEGFSLTVSQLQPEPPPAHSERGCAQEPARLSPLQARVVERIMPDEQLRNEAWRTSGSCTGMSVNAYFRTITNYAGRLKVPPEFNADQAIVMRKEQLVRQLVDLNAGLKNNGLQLNCVKNPKFRQPMLTEIRVCYSPNGGYIECPASVVSNCPERFVVHGAP